MSVWFTTDYAYGAADKLSLITYPNRMSNTFVNDAAESKRYIKKDSTGETRSTQIETKR